MITGAQVEYQERLIFDGLVRYDGSSLFGENRRWHPYARASFAWRVSEEPWWPLRSAARDVKLRASAGTAGGRPSFGAQYETFLLGSGVVTPKTLGNAALSPEHTLETEFGIDAEVFGRAGLSITYARDITRDQLLVVPTPSAIGYPSQWQNAGSLDGRIWEASLRLPLVQRRDLDWTVQLGFDRQRTTITELETLPFDQFFGDNATAGYAFRIAPGVRYGTMYGRRFVTQCSELPAPFNSQCGPGKEWQRNDEGYVVWVGEGFSWQDGIARNLWQASRPGCLLNGVALGVASEVDCRSSGGVVNSPWGVAEMHWGMPIAMRDSTAAFQLLPLGNTLPDYRLTMAHAIRWKRASVWALVDASMGNAYFNAERSRSFSDFMTRQQDQDGKTVATAKPIGYYWRGSAAGLGVGGFYADALATNETVEDGTYTRLREVRLAYDVGRVPFAGGNWVVAIQARNLFTWTAYSGYDPEAGFSAPSPRGSPNSAAITTGSFFVYPSTRTFSLSVSARF